MTYKFGEPGYTSLNFGKAKVVGWGQTGTAADDQIDIVSTDKQQKLDLPVKSNAQCISIYKQLAQIDLKNDIRYNIVDC